MQPIAPGFTPVDVNFLGQSGVIASCLIEGAAGPAVVDPGPASTLDGLRAGLAARGLRVADLRAILLTHIHLDHAGATGTLVRENPAVRVFVHTRGARHVIDPSRLLDSARRLYGDMMDRLWGEVLPVPAENVTALAGGERLDAGGAHFEVAYTPGHAYHHVSYFDPQSGIAFVGDTGGVRVGGSGWIIPPTPPPDIDLDAWAASRAQMRAWRPAMLFLTHFGAFGDALLHLDLLEERLQEFVSLGRRILAAPGTDEERTQRFVSEAGDVLRAHVSPEDLHRWALAAPLEHCWAGLARCLQKLGA